MIDVLFQVSYRFIIHNFFLSFLISFFVCKFPLVPSVSEGRITVPPSSPCLQNELRIAPANSSFGSRMKIPGVRLRREARSQLLLLRLNRAAAAE